ncbi:MAG: hypothetical protein R2729_21925 [Bryobacteraceae bacterium]
MAHFAQKVAFAALLAGAAFAQAPKPFSHKLHLGLKLTCTGCHAAAASSTSAVDNLLPEPAVCAQCHENGTPIGEPRKTLVTKFNHQLHAGMGTIAPVILAALKRGTYLPSTTGAGPAPELETRLASASGCAACHQGLESSERADGSHHPAMQDCLVCHSKIDAPFSCEKCHAPGDHLKPANHFKAEFMDSHSTGRAGLNKATCVSCHGRGFRCMGCHT